VALTEERLVDLYNVALKAADTGARVHYRFRERGDIDAKTKSSPMDLVTMVDGQTEREIVSAIRSLRPTDVIVGEEGGSLPGASEVTWIIDPLDGTTNFVHGYQSHAVAVGVEIDGFRTIGVVYDTFHHRLYSGLIGHHASRDDDPITVSSTPDLATALVAIGFLPDPVIRSVQCRALERILPYVRDVRRSGCPALDFCGVASGVLDCYFESGLKRWDISPGAAIAEAAGATVCEFHSNVLPNPVILAANGTLFAHFADFLKSAGLITGEIG
jgi:myo-inositol-1(or 4)-monophosphatase